MIEVNDLRVSFHSVKQTIQAVRGVSFRIEEGETVGLVGESGSGKSVTASALMGLWKPPRASVSGSILVDGNNILSLKQKQLPEFRRRHFGYIAQEPSQSFDPLYTIGSHFYEMFRLSNPKITRKEARERAAALLTDVGIAGASERLDGFPHQFSGGMLQRIMIALALGAGSRLLIADEPTTALDVTVQAQIIRLLLELKEKRKFSVLFISHDWELTAAVSDRILVMYGGLILESGTSDEVRNHPVSPYTQELLKSLPHSGMSYRDAECHTIPGNVPNPANPEPGCPFAPRCHRKKAECTLSLPPVKGSGHLYRCLFPEAAELCRGDSDE